MKRLHLAEDLSIPLEAITQTFGVLAMRGAGKSNLAAAMAEEMFAAGLPFVVVDPVGAWYGLRSSSDGKKAGLAIPVFGGRHGDVPLEKTGGQLLADLVVDARLSCVLDISELSEGDKIRFLIDFAERLYRRNQDPLHLFLEEADDYAPQRPFRDQARLLRAWENVVRRGRARGLGITMITQRSAALNKNVLTQIETLFVLRTSSPQDRKAIGAWVEYHGQAKELLESLPGLKAGEAWVWSPSWLKVLQRVQIRRRSTFDSGATPKDIKGRRPPATLADVDLGSLKDRMAATIERAKAEDPRELRRRIAELERQIRQAQIEIPKAIASAATKVERVEIPVPFALFTEEDGKRLSTLVDRLEKVTAGQLQALDRVANEVRHLPQARIDQFVKRLPKAPDQLMVGDPSKIRLARPSEVKANTGSLAGVRPPRKTSATSPSGNGRDCAVGLTGPERRILDGLAELEAIGAARPTRNMVAFLAGYTNLQSKGFVNGLGRLSSTGLLRYPSAGQVELTHAGRELARPNPPRTPAELQERVVGLLGGASGRILRPLIAAYPKAIAREELAQAAGYGNLQSKGFVNAIGRLRSLGFIDYESPGRIVAQPVLFLEAS